MVLGNKLKEEKNSPEEKIFSPDKRPPQWKDMRHLLLCVRVEDEAPSPERSSIRKPGGAKPASSG